MYPLSEIKKLPMAGLEPARACTAQRILSPLRLPFRHIGAEQRILSWLCNWRKRISRLPI